jgi:hypothetical protein
VYDLKKKCVVGSNERICDDNGVSTFEDLKARKYEINW